MEKLDILKQYFGYTAFRTGQECLIDAQLQGRDAFGIMPTGGGKSLCYQIPALMLPGVTLVVSPLISLMRDQVMALKDAGVSAAYINSSLNPNQIRLAYRNIQSGMYKIIYVAPERLLTDGFLEAIAPRKISLVTVDEAHCISQWGQDFRPSYLKIVDFLHLLSPRPVVSAFTATATDTVRRDIEQLLGLNNPQRIVTGFDRPNLRFEVRKPKQKDAELLRLVFDRRDKSGIIYCSTRKDVEAVCQLLCSREIPATRYHAGLPEQERHSNQEDFLYDRATVMVATNAFGMGIDKSNVSYVIHYNMPQSLEAYYQEAGRAGRDGSQAECFLLFAARDIHTAKYLIEHSTQEEEDTPERQNRIRQDMLRLNKMVEYCQTERCLRGVILDYFGQTHPEQCGNCGNCDGDLVPQDITQEAIVLFDCIEELYRHLGYSLGKTAICSVLRGSGAKRIVQLGLSDLRCYGNLQQRTEQEVRDLIDNLVAKGYLLVDEQHGGIRLDPSAAQVCSGRETITMLTRKAAPKKQVAAISTGGLLDALKARRWELAKKKAVPAYVIFSNATLEDMARKAPQSMPELLNVSGVGSRKAQQYGEEFLDIIRQYVR